jgi:hypothetical protein
VGLVPALFCKAQKELRQAKCGAEKLREEHTQDWHKKAAALDDAPAEKAIKNVQRREEVRKMWNRLARAMGKQLDGAFEHLLVPGKAEHKFEATADSAEAVERLISRNMRHFSQAEVAQSAQD